MRSGRFSINSVVSLHSSHLLLLVVFRPLHSFSLNVLLTSPPPYLTSANVVDTLYVELAHYRLTQHC